MPRMSVAVERPGSSSAPLGPLVLTRSVRDCGPVRTAAGLGLGGVLLVAAAAVLFSLDRWGEYVGRLTQTGSQLNVSAFNLWHLALGVSQSQAGRNGSDHVVRRHCRLRSRTRPRAFVAAMVWRRPHVGVALPALVLTLGAFVLLPVMRERYLLGALPFAVLLATGWESGRVSRAGVVAAVALSATQFLNLVAVGSPLPGLWTNVFAPIGSP